MIWMGKSTVIPSFPYDMDGQVHKFIPSFPNDMAGQVHKFIPSFSNAMDGQVHKFIPSLRGFLWLFFILFVFCSEIPISK